MLEFPGQVLELSMPVGRGIKPPRPPVGSGMDGQRFSKFEGPFYIISSSGRSPEELSYDLRTLRRPSVRPTVRL